MTTRTPLASVDDLAARTSVAIETLEAINLANAMLRSASARVRAAGDPNWEDYSAPDIAIEITLDAAARGFLNPGGYSLERGDMLTIQRGAAATAGTALTDDEIDQCRAAAGIPGVAGLGLVRQDTVSNCYLPYQWDLFDAPITYS